MSDETKHVLKTCDCYESACPICAWGAGICALCGKVEGELDGPCEPAAPPTSEGDDCELLRSDSSRTVSVNYLQRLGGTCFAHGPYGPEGCPQWPKCATDPQVFKPVQPVSPSAEQDSDIVQALFAHFGVIDNEERKIYFRRMLDLLVQAKSASLRERIVELEAQAREYNRMTHKAMERADKAKARAESAEASLSALKLGNEQLLAEKEGLQAIIEIASANIRELEAKLAGPEVIRRVLDGGKG